MEKDRKGHKYLFLEANFGWLAAVCLMYSDSFDLLGFPGQSSASSRAPTISVLENLELEIVLVVESIYLK